MAVLEYRIKREEDRLKREIEERELKEAEELLAKTGKGKKLKEGEKLDKNAIMQVSTMRLVRWPVQLSAVPSVVQKLQQFDQMSSTATLLSAQTCCKGVSFVGGLKLWHAALRTLLLSMCICRSALFC